MTDFHPLIIGGDIEFLLDTPAGHAIATVGQISEIVESDSFDLYALSAVPA